MNYARWHTHSVLWHVLVFFLQYQPQRERVAEKARENEISWCIVMQHQGSFGLVNLASRMFSPSFKHFKWFPSSAICPSRVRHGGHFYHSNSMRVLFSWTQLGPEHEINLRGAPYELGTYDRCDQRRLRRACVFAQSRQGLAH